MLSQRTLPLFPLHAVLFPGAVLPLRIFEERYKRLVHDCLESDRALGIVLIRSGSEVGGPATPFEVGTLARIIRTDPLQDGKINLAVLGERRFHIRSLVEGQPYLVGEVELWDEGATDPSLGLVEQVRRQFAEYVGTLRQLAQRPSGMVQMPDGALELSYAVAASLQIPPQEQQALLELSAAHRLQREYDLLRREMLLLRHLGAVTTRRLVTPSELAAN
jgi:Lon protease-like protein